MKKPTKVAPKDVRTYLARLNLLEIKYHKLLDAFAANGESCTSCPARGKLDCGPGTDRQTCYQQIDNWLEGRNPKTLYPAVELDREKIAANHLANELAAKSKQVGRDGIGNWHSPYRWTLWARRLATPLLERGNFDELGEKL